VSDQQQTSAPPAPVGLQPKFEKLRDALSVELIERNAIIDTQILALLSGTHHFQLGSPGVAKSLSVQRMTGHIGGLVDTDYFEVLMTRFSAPEEIFGPYDLNALKDSRFARQTNGMAPQAKIWFLDEIWKANASILNALLWALNERKFRNDGHIHDLPLWAMFCASNEMPEGEELNALYDRIHFRHIVRPIQEPGNFINMLKLSTEPSEGEILTWDEVLQAQTEVKAVQVPDDVWDALNKIRTDLRSEGIEPTDRRFRECGKIIKAQTWISGETVADIEHMRALAHVLWTTPEEQPKVERMLLELANPLDKEAMNLLEEVQKLSSELDKVLGDKDMDQQLRNKKGVELHNKVERAKESLQKLKTDVDKSNRKSAKTDEVHVLLLSVTRRLLKELFNIPVDKDIAI